MEAANIFNKRLRDCVDVWIVPNEGKELTGARIAAVNAWILFRRERFTFKFEGITNNVEDSILGGLDMMGNWVSESRVEGAARGSAAADTPY